MKKLFYCMLAGSVIFTACNDENNKSPQYNANTNDQAEKKNETDAAVDKETSDFMMTAATTGMMEVMLGEMAQRNAASQQVKDFGNRMITDHSKANAELKTLAAARNVMLPVTVEGPHREHVNFLGQQSGAKFDKEYMDMMVKDHEKDINLFENMANNSKDAAVKAFAAKTLPTLKAHHEAAKNIREQLK
jgi:putative membrane protein